MPAITHADNAQAVAAQNLYQHQPSSVADEKVATAEVFGSTQAVVRSRGISMYELEDNLVAIFNSIDMVDGEEERKEAEQMLLQAYLQAVDKRDRVGHFLAHLESQQQAIDTEIERLTELKAKSKRAQERTEQYIVQTIQAIGPDDRGKYRKLDGNTTSFSIAKKPDTVEVSDQDRLPHDLTRVKVTVNGADWDDFVDELDIDLRTAFLSKVTMTVEPAKTEIGKRIKAALGAAEKTPEVERDAAVEAAAKAVPGAAMKAGGFRLVRK